MNLVAVRLVSWRGKLVNTYYVYEDLRIARLVGEDLRGVKRGLSPLTVVVDQVQPMPFQGIGETDYPYADPGRYDNLRIAMSETVGSRLVGWIHVNEAGGDSSTSRRYVVRQSHLFDREGQRADAFGRLMEEGVSQMVTGQGNRAIGFFERAVQARPFLLNYCLSPGLRLEDIRWLTGGQEFREWLRKVHARWRTKTEKFESTRSVMEQELSEYALCLFYLSYLEAQEGREERSRYWLSQIYYLEQDPERLISWISQVPVVKANEEMGRFVGCFRDGAIFDTPLPWRKDDYGFERFLARLLLQWDVLSKWDVRAGVRA